MMFVVDYPLTVFPQAHVLQFSGNNKQSEHGPS